MDAKKMNWIFFRPNMWAVGRDREGEEKQIKNEGSTSPLHTRKKNVLNNEKKCEIYLSGFESSINFNGSVFFPFHRHFGNEFCQKHVIISLSLSVSTRIECYAINIAFEMLSSQSRVHKLWASLFFPSISHRNSVSDSIHICALLSYHSNIRILA